MSEKKPSLKVGYHHGHLREALLQEGLRALEQQGESGLSLRATAKQLGVSANAVYRHFADKDAWLNAMAAEGFRQFAQSQQDAVARQGGNEDRIKASGRAYIAFAMARPALFRLMFERVTRPSCDLALQQVSMEALSVLLGCAADMVHAPIDSEQTRIYAAGAWALVHGLSELLMGKQLMVLGLAPEAVVDQVLNTRFPEQEQAKGKTQTAR